MTEQEFEAGISPVGMGQVLHVSAAQLGVPNLVATEAEQFHGKDRVFRANEALWDTLLSDRLHATAVVRLDNFWLSEWFPLRPGLFHTMRGRQNRERARRYLLAGPGVGAGRLRGFEQTFGRSVSPELFSRLHPEFTYVYDPRGKSAMLDGGVGCIRLKSKHISSGQVWFMGASSSAIAHEGVPVAVPIDLYRRYIDQITTEGSVCCRITGQLAHIPADFDTLYRDLVDIPQLYLLVEELSPTRNANKIRLMADGAVMVEAGNSAQSLEDGYSTSNIYAAFVSFAPGIQNAVRHAAKWLEDIYVGELLGGRVLTDFDEHVRHFSGAVFGLDLVMGGEISAVEAERLLRRCMGDSQYMINQFVQRIETVNGGIHNTNIHGVGNVVAYGAGAAAGTGGAAAAGTSAAAAQSSAASAGKSSASISLVRQAKMSRWTRLFGLLALVATVVATVLLVRHQTSLGIAGYIVAVIAVIVGIIPLLSK